MAKILLILILVAAGNAHAQSSSPSGFQRSKYGTVSPQSRLLVRLQPCLGTGERVVLVLTHTAAGAAVGLAASATVSLFGGATMSRTTRYFVPFGAVLGFVAGIRVTSGRDAC